MEKRPEEYLGYWIFYTERTLAYAFYDVLKACCLEHNKPYVVTPPQWGVVSLLYWSDSGLTIGTISQRRALDAPTVTGIVKRLEQSGLVERVHDREDRRVVKVYLTDEGRDIMRYLPDVADAFNTTLLRGFSEAEERDLVTKLQKIIVNLSALGPNMGDRFGLLPDFFQSDQEDKSSC